MKFHRSFPIALLPALFPSFAFAHGGGAADGFADGFYHPVMGLDHFLAMLSVGLLSTQIGGRAIWTVPASFVAFVGIGAVLGIYGFPVPFADIGVLLSVIILGLLIAGEKRLPTLGAMAGVAFFAIFHGRVHGETIALSPTPGIFLAGFMTGTAVIHLLGVLIGEVLRLKVKHGPLLLRYGGAAIAGVGVKLFLVG